MVKISRTKYFKLICYIKNLQNLISIFLFHSDLNSFQYVQRHDLKHFLVLNKVRIIFIFQNYSIFQRKVRMGNGNYKLLMQIKT